MGVVVVGMAPVVVHFGGKKKQEQQEEDIGHATSANSSSADDNVLGPLPSILPKGIKIPSLGYAPKWIAAPAAQPGYTACASQKIIGDVLRVNRYWAISHDVNGQPVHTSFRTAWSSAHIVIPVQNCIYRSRRSHCSSVLLSALHHPAAEFLVGLSTPMSTWHNNSILILALSPNNRWVVTAGWDGHWICFRTAPIDIILLLTSSVL